MAGRYTWIDGKGRVETSVVEAGQAANAEKKGHIKTWSLALVVFGVLSAVAWVASAVHFFADKNSMPQEPETGPGPNTAPGTALTADAPAVTNSAPAVAAQDPAKPAPTTANPAVVQLDSADLQTQPQARVNGLT